MLRSFFDIIIFLLAGLACGCGTNIEQSNDSGVYNGYIVSGIVNYQNNVVANSMVAIINMDTYAMIDEAVSDSDGNFALLLDEPGNYYLLAGQDGYETNLMAALELSVEASDTFVNVELTENDYPELFEDNETQTCNLNCWTVSQWWHICYKCCSSTYYPICFWAWC